LILDARERELSGTPTTKTGCIRTPVDERKITGVDFDDGDVVDCRIAGNGWSQGARVWRFH
jgi:hypothetical protein